MAASSQRSIRATRWRRSLFRMSASDEQEDPGIEEASKQGADQSAGQPIEPTEVPNDQGRAADDQRHDDERHGDTRSMTRITRGSSFKGPRRRPCAARGRRGPTAADLDAKGRVPCPGHHSRMPVTSGTTNSTSAWPARPRCASDDENHALLTETATNNSPVSAAAAPTIGEPVVSPRVDVERHRSIQRGLGLSRATIYLIAASTMAMSCSVVPPLTPTPAITWPSLVSGTPPPIAEYLPPETARRG